MSRPYENLPRQGQHADGSVDAEPTTNVRAHPPAHPPERSKATGGFHVLLVDRSAGRYRLTVVPKDAGRAAVEGFEVVDQVPEAGDLQRLYDRLPEGPTYAVFEQSESGELYYAPDRRIDGDWTNDAMFDQVTIFTEKGDAEAYLEERRGRARSE